MPVARRAEDSFDGLPPARHGSNSGRMPVARDPEDSFTGLPPARRRASESSSTPLPPARREPSGGRRSAAETSFSGLPPARRTPSRSEESFSGLPPVHREADSGRRAARRSDPATTSASTTSSIPPVRTGADSPAAASLSMEESFGRMPSVRGPNDPFGDPPPRHGADSGTGGRRRAPEDSFATMAIEEGPGGAHRAEDLTPDFGVPAKRRRVNPELSSLRLVPAMSSVDESFERMQPARMPKHGRPEDYGFVPGARPGPEDSYDRMPPVDRPAHSTGGRRRARA